MPQVRLATLFCAFLIAGCGAVEPRPPISSVGRAISSAGAEGLKAAGINTDTEAEATPSAARPGAPEIIEFTVDPANRDDMKKLVPFLLGRGTEWQLVGVTMHPGGKRTWRWLHLDTDGVRINPFDLDRSVDTFRPFTPRKPNQQR